MKKYHMQTVLDGTFGLHVGHWLGNTNIYNFRRWLLAVKNNSLTIGC